MQSRCPFGGRWGGNKGARRGIAGMIVAEEEGGGDAAEEDGEEKGVSEKRCNWGR